MRSGWFSARMFSLMFGLCYALAIAIDLPLFRYYPLVERFSLHDQVDRSLGPAMTWYGWIVAAAIPAALLAIVVPNRLADRIPEQVLWGVPVLVLAAGFYCERGWFL